MMAAPRQPARPLSAASSAGAYDSLFDGDDECTLGVDFDLDVQMVDAAPCAGHTNKASSAGSSCCSLCRPPAVSEDEAHGALLAPPSGHYKPPPLALGGASGGCLCRSPFASCLACEQPGPFVPVRSISIPRRVPFATKDLRRFPRAGRAPSDGRNCLSSALLPDDALGHVVRYLDVPSLLRLGECDRRLREAVCRGSAGWKERCTALWSTKANVCSAARALLEEETKTKSAQDVSDAKCAAMEAYKLSVADAARRTEVSFEEMCFDASDDAAATTCAVWSFRFKESAGRDWTSWDPWWRGSKARKLVFLKDGTVRQVHPQGLESSAVAINGTRLYDVFSERTVQRDGRDVPAPRIEMSWRFVAKPLDLPARPNGAYVRITVGGRDVPTYVVRRSPTGNWGFVLESCWGVYASYEMAPKAPPPSYLGRTRRRLRRTAEGGQWVNVLEESDGEGDEGADGEHEQERMRNVRRRIDLLVEESAMTQDGRSQWREALLYNIGAVTLPEGRDTQAEEFDRAWQNAMFLRR